MKKILFIFVLFISINLYARKSFLTHTNFDLPSYAYYNKIENYECVLTLPTSGHTTVVSSSTGKTINEGLRKLLKKRVPFGPYIFWVKPVYGNGAESEWYNFPVKVIESKEK